MINNLFVTVTAAFFISNLKFTQPEHRMQIWKLLWPKLSAESSDVMV